MIVHTRDFSIDSQGVEDFVLHTHEHNIGFVARYSDSDGLYFNIKFVYYHAKNRRYTSPRFTKKHIAEIREIAHYLRINNYL